ncbi:hypothetical protein FIV07_27675 (plasmid) [Mycobacterium sp. THAF192]|nr:hypothetical protein FIV07_27675 [Mycobacterium sp. THAF192]
MTTAPCAELVGKHGFRDSQACSAGPVVDEFDAHVGPRYRTVTRVRWAGWTVHILDDAVTVPRQSSDGKSIADLATCLRSAYAELGVIGDRTSGPTTGLRGVPRDTELAAAVAQVIVAAAQLAAPLGHCDVYFCLRKAWQDGAMRVPYAAVLATVRASLPDNTTLADFNDGTPGSGHIVELLRRAAGKIGQNSPPRSSVFVEARSA